MSVGQSKPETVSVRIREDDYAKIREISTDYGVKVVDAVQALVDLWDMIGKEDQEMVMLGEELEQEPEIIYKSEPGETFQVTYKKPPPPQ